MRHKCSASHVAAAFAHLNARRIERPDVHAIRPSHRRNLDGECVGWRGVCQMRPLPPPPTVSRQDLAQIISRSEDVFIGTLRAWNLEPSVRTIGGPQGDAQFKVERRFKGAPDSNAWYRLANTGPCLPTGWWPQIGLRAIFFVATIQGEKHVFAHPTLIAEESWVIDAMKMIEDKR
jgi:hypothetical protein